MCSIPPSCGRDVYKRQAYHSINEKLRDTFAKHNVEMTYDHLNVHILDK